MPGLIDTNGVYRYAEDDEIPTLSAFMDKGQAAQSVAFSSARARLAALEAAAPLPVLTGRFTGGQTVATSSVVGSGTWTPNATYSSTGSTTLWTPIANGLRFNQKGIYFLTVQIKITGGVSGRCFVDVVVGSENRRLDYSPIGEDNITLTTEITIINPNTSVTLAFFQASGSSKALTEVVDIVRLGGLS
jgi:hypothetical protein